MTSLEPAQIGRTQGREDTGREDTGREDTGREGTGGEDTGREDTGRGRTKEGRTEGVRGASWQKVAVPSSVICQMRQKPEEGAGEAFKKCSQCRASH